jgi:hypothetical protein
MMQESRQLETCVLGSMRGGAGRSIMGLSRVCPLVYATGESIRRSRLIPQSSELFFASQCAASVALTSGRYCGWKTMSTAVLLAMLLPFLRAGLKRHFLTAVMAALSSSAWPELRFTEAEVTRPFGSILISTETLPPMPLRSSARG